VIHSLHGTGHLALRLALRFLRGLRVYDGHAMARHRGKQNRQHKYGRDQHGSSHGDSSDFTCG